MDHQEFRNSSVTNRFVPGPTRPQDSLRTYLRTDVHVACVVSVVCNLSLPGLISLMHAFIACSIKSPWENLSQSKRVYQRRRRLTRRHSRDKISQGVPPAIEAWERG